MRKVGGPTPGQLREYIPKAFGNRRDRDPVTVVVRTPTEADKRALSALGDATRVVVDNDGQPVTTGQGNYVIEVDTAKAVEVDQATVRRFVVEVRNYTGADGKAIDTADRLAEHGETELLSEVASEIRTALSLTASEGKDCAGSSDSSAAGTRLSDGTAPHAGATDSPSNETATASGRDSSIVPPCSTESTDAPRHS